MSDRQRPAQRSTNHPTPKPDHLDGIDAKPPSGAVMIGGGILGLILVLWVIKRILGTIFLLLKFGLVVGAIVLIAAVILQRKSGNNRGSKRR